MKSATTGLIEKRSVEPRHRVRSLKRFDQIRRDNEVAESKTREKTFAERARVDHAILVVQSLKRGKRLAAVAKL
jgi:hypothetical protein